MSEQPINDVLKTRVLKVLEKSLQIKLSDTTINLVETGMLDSLSLIEFIVALENEFSIDVSFDDLDLNRFKTINEIALQVTNSKPRVKK